MRTIVFLSLLSVAIGITATLLFWYMVIFPGNLVLRIGAFLLATGLNALYYFYLSDKLADAVVAKIRRKRGRS